MRILRKFIKLTSRTYPYGTEYLLERHLPNDYGIDSFGNYFFQIGNEPTTMFTCHLDTASHSVQKVNHVFQGNIVKTDGRSILGADDKAGMVVLLYMIEKEIPGLYYFFLGEERGCIGSGMAAKTFNKVFPYINKVISFDRRGTTSVITHQMSGRCCSDIFAKTLSSELNEIEPTFNYRPDSTGIYTDSAEFVDIVAECTNISVGYQNEHTTSENQDIEHLRKLCLACTKIDWESLPVNRLPGEDDWRSGEYDWSHLGYSNRDEVATYTEFEEEEEYEFVEDFIYKEENFAYINYDGNGPKKAYISQTRINYEKELIHKMLINADSNPGRILWDGSTCYMQECSDGLIYVGTRNELINFIPELAEIPSYYIKYDLNKKSELF